MIKTVYEKNFIASEAKKTLASAVKNSFIVPDLIPTFIEGLNNKNITLSEYSIGYLGDAV